MVVDVTAMSRGSGWDGRRRLELAGGAALAYGWHAFLQTPLDGTTGLIIRASNAVCVLIVRALVAFAAKRQRIWSTHRNSASVQISVVL